MLDIIEKKKLGQELTEEEIRFFVNAAARNAAPDYQLSAMLMAIRLNGMTPRETVALTLSMRDSGEIADLSAIPGLKVDKHSTGGVGDTTTLVLVPLVAACGGTVAKMSGRGLGHTGGTLDKLEAVPGLRTGLTVEEFIAQVKDIGLAVVGQTAELAPADKTLYALRDVTSTVDSLPLIVSSILSKKLSSGVDGIVLDVKCGSGALMRTREESVTLARTMVEVCHLAGKPAIALVSGMDQPLGTHVGNALEVKEAIDVLSGRAAGELLDLSLTLGAFLLMLGGLAESPAEGRAKLREALRSGRGLEKLRQMIRAQGGDPRVCDDTDLLPRAPVIRAMTLTESGWICGMDTTALGLAAQRMGAGRLRKEDVIDPAVGFVLRARIGDRVEKGQEIGTLHARCPEDADRAEEAIRGALRLSASACPKAWEYLAWVDERGVHPMAARDDEGKGDEDA